VRPSVLHHFSEDPAIERFVPHVPATNPNHPPAVWAIDAAHAPLYWFPRDCPRVTVWAGTDAELAAFQECFTTAASRLHAIEHAWLPSTQRVELYRYDLPAGSFAPWTDADGQWISTESVVPLGVAAVGNVIDLHARASIELRIVPSLWPLRDVVAAGPWPFSLVRMLNAQAR
jgi:hypothetical protein